MSTEEIRRGQLMPFEQALAQIDAGETPEALPFGYLNQLLDSYQGGTSRRQVMICFNKWMHNFDYNNLELNLAHLVGEVSELMVAINTDTRDNIMAELADVAIYCYGIAQIFGSDLDTAIESKMQYNLQRSYQRKDGD